MLRGLNHLTLSVSELGRSIEFYRDVLGLILNARWDTGAYLSLPDLWLCLTLDNQRSTQPHPEYTHYAFTVTKGDFVSSIEHLRTHGVEEWRQNQSEGDSFYFLDPDGHKLEIHVGDLHSRLDACRQNPYSGMEILIWPGDGAG
ncbi:fosfomycin resistance glutathione transferase [Kushneria indalinina]|uniref:Catechol 2,3-dioxygenase-like lactoylglutathione lyase family enzyme n=1 Tax=Kushneria indalinina DSM 14324 TaxID=1122140 RepID=A0A3D9DWB0_9GAMM|nr:fosfomycin resistance glutathione transferase [Kushneria indalinina]REC94935.1 catechol 2,3-dioxygenase-like lactoylglutathione lyase family enzyme [Kushneria indalinina DSM 14324]